jgi:PTH1 family peptidyl-tRNA hydrolase
VRLVVGLGNPGERYAATRHNVAWQVLDELARRWDARELAPDPLYAARRARVAGDMVDLVRPLTYMNLAGDAVGRWVEAHGGPPGDLLVVGDDVYLPVGAIRLRAQGSSGGHRGLESVARALGSTAFARLRIGVGAAASGAELKEHVLDTFTPDERLVIDEATRRAADAVECWAADGITAAMNRFNRRIEEESEP